MKFDLWMPTASPMTTAALLDVVATGAEERGIGTIWVGEHVVLFNEYESQYPYADDGRIPAPPGSGLLEPMVTLTYLAARTTTVRLGTAMLLLPQRNPVYTAKEVSTPRLALRRPSRSRHRRRLAQGGVRRAQRALGAPGPPHRRVPRGVAHALARRDVLLPRRGLRPARLRDVPQAGATASPGPHRRGDDGRLARERPVTGRAGTPSTGRPTSWRRGWPNSTAELEAVGRSRAELRITVCPYFNQLTPEWVEGYAEAGADAVAALFFAFTPDDVARAFDDLESCREAAARAGG